jgi:hypothetical protein
MLARHQTARGFGWYENRAILACGRRFSNTISKHSARSDAISAQAGEVRPVLTLGNSNFWPLRRRKTC